MDSNYRGRAVDRKALIFLDSCIIGTDVVAFDEEMFYRRFDETVPSFLNVNVV